MEEDKQAPKKYKGMLFIALLAILVLAFCTLYVHNSSNNLINTIDNNTNNGTQPVINNSLNKTEDVQNESIERIGINESINNTEVLNITNVTIE